MADQSKLGRFDLLLQQVTDGEDGKKVGGRLVWYNELKAMARKNESTVPSLPLSSFRKK